MSDILNNIGNLILTSFTLFLIVVIAQKLLELTFPEFFSLSDSPLMAIAYLSMKNAIKYSAYMIGLLVAGVVIYYVYVLSQRVR